MALESPRGDSGTISASDSSNVHKDCEETPHFRFTTSLKLLSEKKFIPKEKLSL